MDEYRRILIAVDFSPSMGAVLRRAMAMAAPQQATLSLLHVVEYLPLVMEGDYLMPSHLEIEAQLLRNAKAQLAQLAAKHGVPAAVEQRVDIGSTKLEILAYAQARAVDLIVIGSHGRHGWTRMLGSTANAVMHGAACDVLAVRVPV